MEATFATFGESARRVAAAARTLGLQVPTFRTPPRTPGVDRALRRRRDGSTEVTVRLQGRTARAVEADLVEGVLLANGRSGDDARALRRSLLAAVAVAPAA